MKTKVFLCIECVLYILFILMDCFFPEMGKASMDLKYMGIVLCFFYVICLLPKDTETEDTVLVQTAIFFTLLADTFLVKLGRSEAGVACFIMVQICYFYRLHKGHSKSIFWNCAIFGLLYLVLDICLEQIEFVVVLALFYIITLIRNVWDSLWLSENRLFQLGLILFLLCDLSVGLYNVPGFVAVPQWYHAYIYPAVAVLMWAFYLPSQVLLCLSIKKR